MVLLERVLSIWHEYNKIQTYIYIYIYIIILRGVEVGWSKTYRLAVA